MAMTLEQISQLETAKKTGQPQDMAAMLALLMGGQNPLSPSSSTNLGSDVGVGGTNIGTPLGTTPGGLGTGQDQQTSALVDLLSNVISGGGGGDVPGPVSAPGPGPNTANAIAQAVVDAIASGKDPSQVANDMIAQNQQDINIADIAGRIASFFANPTVSVFNEAGKFVGGRPGGAVGTAAGKTLQTLGVIPAIPNPVSIPAGIASWALDLLSKNAKEGLKVTGRGVDPETVGFLEANMPNATPQGLPSGPTPGTPSGVPSGTGGGGGDVGVPGAGGMPSSPDVGPASISTEAPADPSVGTAGGPTATQADPQGFSFGTTSVDLSTPATTSTEAAPDANAPGITNPSGEGTTGGGGAAGGGGPGSVLANFATGNNPPPQFYDFYDKFMEAHPKDGKKLFTAYQTVAKRVIAKAKSRGEEEDLADRVYSDFIDPISRYIDDDEVGLATDTLVRTTKNLAKRYGVPIPDRYDNVLKRNGGGRRGT